MSKYNYQQYVGRTPNFFYERRDCSVRALSKVIGDDYPLAHQILELGGRQSRRGFRFESWLRKQDWIKVEEIQFSYTKLGKDKMTPKKFCEQYSKGKYLVIIKGHTFAVIDGVIYDSFRVRPGTRVFCAYKVVEEQCELSVLI